MTGTIISNVAIEILTSLPLFIILNLRISQIGSKTLHCSEYRGYRICQSAFVNLNCSSVYVQIEFVCTFQI